MSHKKSDRRNPRLRIRKAGHPRKHNCTRSVTLAPRYRKRIADHGSYRKQSPGRRGKFRIIKDPVRSPNHQRDRKRREARKHRIRVQGALERIMYLLPGGIQWSPFTDRIRAVLEDVL